MPSNTYISDPSAPNGRRIVTTGAPGADGTNGTNGWSPKMAMVSDGTRRVQQIVDWQGGNGTKPAIGGYIGTTGIVTDIADGVDIRGTSGTNGTNGSGIDAQSIRGVNVAATAPTNGQALVFNGTNYVPGAVTGGGGTVEIDTTNSVSPLTLTAAQSAAQTLIFAGGRSAALDVYPAAAGARFVRNRCGQTVNFLAAQNSGAKQSVADGEARLILNDADALFAGAALTRIFGSLPITNGLVLYLRADSLSLANNAAVAAWNDESGLNNHAAQATSGNQPIFVQAAQNGKPAVRFNGSTQYLTVPHAASLNLTSLTAFIVYKLNNTSSAMLAKRNSDASENYGLMGSNGSNSNALRLATINNSTSRDYNSTLGAAGYQSACVTVDGATNQVNFYRSGVASGGNPQTLLTALAGNTSPICIGGQFTSSGFNSPMNGDILEVMLYNRALSASERQNVESYSGSKYAL